MPIYATWRRRSGDGEHFALWMRDFSENMLSKLQADLTCIPLEEWMRDFSENMLSKLQADLTCIPLEEWMRDFSENMLSKRELPRS